MQDAFEELDRIREACGVFGIYAPKEDVSRITFFGLFALQHRGQESAGIATSNGKDLLIRRSMGLVTQAFDEADLASLHTENTHIAIGHTRYSTTGSSRIENAQPIMMECELGVFALAHNGNLTNTSQLLEQLDARGETIISSSDSEVIAKLIALEPGNSWLEKIRRVMPKLAGAYSLTVCTPSQLIGIRDPNGVRPLCVGKMGDNWIIASESCAIDTVGGKLFDDVKPGEIVIIDNTGDKGLHRHVGQMATNPAMCLFEYIYFSRPDSVINNKSLYMARQRMGVILAEEYPIDIDLVIGVPDSATPAATGYATARKIPYADGLIKNRYIGRTFIQPDQKIRQLGVKLKFNALQSVLKGKRVVVVDDSIVRGTTVAPLVKLIREAGAKEVHLGITSPRFLYPCYLGLDVAQRSELIAAKLPTEEAIGKAVGADSIHYLSLEGLIKAIDLDANTFCSGCFTGKYPVPVQESFDKLILEQVPAGSK